MQDDSTTLGQRVTSALVDVVFFAVIGALGFVGKLSEPTLAVLLGSYASARFGIAYGKQQTVVALAQSKQQRGGDRTDPPPPSGSGSSQQLPAVRPDPRVEQPWQRRTISTSPDSPIIGAIKLLRQVHHA